MDDLIYDAYSIFYQVLALVAPDYVGNIEFLLICYTFSCVFIIVIVWAIFKMLTAFANAVVKWFYRGT